MCQLRVAGGKIEGPEQSYEGKVPKGSAVLRPSVGDPRISSSDKKLIRKRAPRRLYRRLLVEKKSHDEELV